MPGPALPSAPAAACSFDVAIWLMERARADDMYLQPRKLHSIMFLAQAHFAAGTGGRRLMPSIFVFDEGGALDPNTYRAFENGRPPVTETPLPKEVTALLDTVWRRYADCDALRLDQVIARRGRREPAVRERNGSEITLAAMLRMFAPRPEAPEKARAAPRTARVVNPRPVRPDLPPRTVSARDGRPLTVTKWVPGMKAPVG